MPVRTGLLRGGLETYLTIIAFDLNPDRTEIRANDLSGNGAAIAFLTSPAWKAAGTTDGTAFLKSPSVDALDHPADATGLANSAYFLNCGEGTAAIATSSRRGCTLRA